MSEEKWTEYDEKLAQLVCAKPNVSKDWKIGIGLLCKEQEHTIQMIEFLKTHPNATEDECIETVLRITGIRLN